MKKQLYSLLPFFLTCTIFGNALSCNAATEDTDKKTTITFMDTGTGDYATQYKESLEAILLEDFPDIEIEVEAYPDEQYYSILSTRLSMGEGPDFFMVQPNLAGPNAVKKLAPAGYLEPLDDLPIIQSAPGYDTDAVSWNGHVYTLSRSFMLLCTYYNQEIFDSLNLSIPTNWPEFLDVCETLKNAGITPIISGNKDSYALQFGLYQFAASLVYENNPGFNEDLEDGTTHFTDPGTWDTVIDQYLLLYKNHYVQEHSLSMSNSEAIQRFANGEAAMMFGGNFYYHALANEMGSDNLGAFPLPANAPGDPIYTVISKPAGTAIYSGSKHIDLCKKIWEKLENVRNNSSDSIESNTFWSNFTELQQKRQYTINCNQGWKGNVEAVLEDYVSQKIGGALFSVHYITQQMQTAYDLG